MRGARVVGSVTPGGVAWMDAAASPSLDALADHPALLDGLPPAELAALYRRAARLEADLRAALLVLTLDGRGPAGDGGAVEGDRLLPVREAEAKLAVSADWLYRHAARLPFTVRVGRHLRFSARGIDRWLRLRQAR